MFEILDYFSIRAISKNIARFPFISWHWPLHFQVLSRAALAVHDRERLPEFSWPLDCSVAGPQVRTRPRQLAPTSSSSLATFPRHLRDLKAVQSLIRKHESFENDLVALEAQLRVLDPSLQYDDLSGPHIAQVGGPDHIYMEVDPPYSIMAEPVVVSSSTSKFYLLFINLYIKPLLSCWYLIQTSSIKLLSYQISKKKYHPNWIPYNRITPNRIQTIQITKIF